MKNKTYPSILKVIYIWSYFSTKQLFFSLSSPPFLFVVHFVIHWNETAMGLHVFPIPIPPPTSLSTRSL